MARWLRDAETGELFQEDELDPSSYDSVSDFQPIAGSEPEAPQYEFPSWLTSGLNTTIPARSIASAARGGAGIEELLGDLASNIPGLENNWLQRNAAENRQMAEDLVDQSRTENQVIPGSWQDIGGAAAGEIIPSLGTLGYGLLRGMGKAALAMAPTILPSATKYSDLQEKGVSGPDAALGAGESFILNSLLNRADVGTALNALSSPAKRIGQTALVGGATNAAGTYGDALIDKQVGAPQTPEQFMTNLATSAATGFGTGAGFGTMGALGRSIDSPVLDGQDADSMMAKMRQEPPPAPPSDAGASTRTGLVLDSDVPIIEQAAPQAEPLIKLEDAYRARDLSARQRQLENLFLPEDSELVGLRETGVNNPTDVIPGTQRRSPATEPVTLASDPEELSAVEREAANKVRVVSDARVQKAQIAENEAGLRELLAKRDEVRRSGRSSSLLSDKDLTLKIGEQDSSFPEPIIKNLSEAAALPPAKMQLPPGAEVETSPLPLSLAPDRLKPAPPPTPEVQPVEVYQSRTPPKTLRYDPLMEQIDRLTRGSSSLVSESDIPIIGQEASAVQPPDIISPDSANERPGSVYLDPQSELGSQRAAGRRLINAQRQEAASIIPGEVYRARTEERVAAVKPKGTHPDDLRNSLGRRRATRSGKTRGVTSKEAGFIDLTDLVNFFGLNKDKLEKQKLSGYQDWSDSNKRYSDKGWLNYGRRWEWMDTTRKNEPASAPFIDSQWAIPQDTHAIVWDADETLALYKSAELTPKERRGVDTYLQNARILGGQDKGYKVSAETAATAGLNPKQVEAALSVKRWSNFFADLFENDSLAQAEHVAAMETLKAQKEGKPPGYSAAIAKRLEETKAKIGETFKGWRDSNYVPFDRYGEHYINVFDKEGKLIARQQFESNTDPAFRKAIAEYEELARQPGEYSGATVKTGRQAPKDLLQDFGVNQDILDILGTEGSGQPIEGFSRHLKKVVKLKAGQNTDLNRAVTDYTVGAARLLAFRRANRAAEMELATTLAGDDKINLRNKLKEFQVSLNNPKGEGIRLLNDYFNFAYIGGNARTPIADTLGFFQMQSMVLSKYLKGVDPEKVELKTYGNLINYYFGRKLDDGLSAGIKQAQRKGVIPTDTFKTYLRARRGPSDAMKMMSTAKDAYFSLKALSERAVDAGAFMSGWEAWKRLPVETRKSVSQQQFAENMVREMRAVPSQYELPPNDLFKTETGRLVSKFRLYQAKLGKTILETPMPGKLRGALKMYLTVGMAGLPLVKEAFTLARSFGYEPEDKLREKGATSGDMYGQLSALTGVDWSGTAGFGETFPMQSDNPVNKFLLGMLGAPGEAGIRAKQYYERGQNSKAVAALPISNLLSNYLNQADWGNRGVVTMGGKAVIPRDDVQGVDRFKKLLGLQPLRVKEAMVMENRKKQAAAASRDNSFINQRLGEAIGLGNLEEAQALREWARDNGITINSNSVKEYTAKIQGKDGKIPKKARKDIRRIEDIYGNSIRD